MTDPSEDPAYCKCASAKTRGHVKQYKNKCPTCSHKLSDITDYNSENDSKNLLNKAVVEWIGGLSTDSVSHTRPNKNDGSVKIKPPVFQGKGDPAYFFIKIKNYLETNNVQTEKEKVVY